MPDLSWAEVVLRIVLAAALGGAIGLERELREREAGLRTHMLVSVGAALFTMVSAYAWTDWRFSNEEGIVFADCDLNLGLHAKRWFDSVGHYSREDVLMGEIGLAGADQAGSSSNSTSPTTTSSPGSNPAR